MYNSVLKIWYESDLKDNSNMSLFFLINVPIRLHIIININADLKDFGANWCLLLVALYKLLYFFFFFGRDFRHFKILTWDLYNLTIHRGVTLCLWWRPISGTWYCCVLVSLPEELKFNSSESTYKQRWKKKWY